MHSPFIQARAGLFEQACFNHGLDEEPLESNESIQLLNKFDSLFSEDQYEPYEEGEIHEEYFISSDKEESPESCFGQLSPPNIPTQKSKPQGRPQGSKSKRFVKTA